MGVATDNATAKKKRKAEESPVRTIAEGNKIATAGGVKAQYTGTTLGKGTEEDPYKTYNEPVSAEGAAFNELEKRNIEQSGDINKIIAFQQKQNLKEYLSTEKKKGREMKDIVNDFMKGSVQGGTQGQPSKLASPDTALTSDIKGKATGEFSSTDTPPPVSTILGETVNALTSEENPITSGVGTVAQDAAQLIGSVSNLLPEEWRFGTGKSVEVKKAEQTFMDASKIINDDIALVEMGYKDIDEVNQHIDAAISSIRDLRGQLKGTGKLNLRYWLDKGKEIETQADMEISTLEQQRAKLLRAYEKAQMQEQRDRQAEISQKFGVKT